MLTVCVGVTYLVGGCWSYPYSGNVMTHAFFCVYEIDSQSSVPFNLTKTYYILINPISIMNFIFGIITFLVGTVSLIVWYISLISGADTVAIYFWISAFSLFLLFLTLKGVIDIKSTKEMEIQKRMVINQQEKALKVKEEEEVRLVQSENQKQFYIDTFGYLSKEIKLLFNSPKNKTEDIINKILIFESSKKIIIQEKEFWFPDILSFELKDDEQMLYQSSYSTSKSSTSTGSMIGRAVVGGVLLGGVGALVGGATAKKNITTTSTSYQPIVNHNFRVDIVVNSISDPQIIVNLGKNNIAADELVAVLSVILERNKNTVKEIA